MAVYLVSFVFPLSSLEFAYAPRLTADLEFFDDASLGMARTGLIDARSVRLVSRISPGWTS